MTIEFSCSQCNAELQIRDEDRGKKARCPRCGMIHEVPAANGDAELSRSSSSRSNTATEEPTVYHPGPSPPGPSSPGPSTVETSPYLQWLLKTPDGQIYGPVERTELDAWKQQGRVSAACLVQMQGQTHWQSAVTLYPDLTEWSAQDVDSRGRQRYGHRHWLGTRPPQGRSRDHRGFRRPNNGGAILVMGILGICFVFVPIFALIAWSMGYSERRAINRGDASPQFRWMVDVGYVLGIIGSIMGCLTIFGCCLRINFG